MLELMTKEAATVQAEIKAGQWYDHINGSRSREEIYVLQEEEGSAVQMMNFGGNGGLSKPAPRFKAIVADTGRELEVCSHSIGRQGIGSLSRSDRGDILSAEEIEALRQKQREIRAAEEAERQAIADENAKQRDAFPAKYPHLETGKSSTKSGWALAAANIRRELRLEFPGHKFKVTSDSFSMGCSVDIGWSDGPTSEEVEKITGKYQTGYFNSMEDLQEHHGSPFSDVFGSAKYVSPSRSGTLEGYREAWTKAGNPDAEKITQGGTYGYEYAGSDDPGRDGVEMVFRQWRKTSLFTKPPEAERKPRAVKGATANIESGHTITEQTHSKKGFQMWIVSLTERVSRDRFSELLRTAKERGGWYSRKWEESPAGYAFKDKAKAEEFGKAV